MAEHLHYCSYLFTDGPFLPGCRIAEIMAPNGPHMVRTPYDGTLCSSYGECMAIPEWQVKCDGHQLRHLLQLPHCPLDGICLVIADQTFVILVMNIFFFSAMCLL